MNLLLVNGSPHKNGETARALRTIEKTVKQYGIDTIWFQLGTEPVRGCIDCCRCTSSHRCAFEDDSCNELIEKILQTDGVIIGTPVYFAGANGALCSLLDRVFYAASNFGRLFTGKPAAAIATCWRAGGTSAMERINRYFTYSEMPIVSSNYWNMHMTGSDVFGDGIMRQLGVNMAKMLLGKQ